MKVTCVKVKVILEETAHNSGSSSASGPRFVFPTTFAQQRLWFLEQLQPGTVSYLIHWSLRIEGALNVEALEKSLGEITRRHEILRTTFTWKDGMPSQVVGSGEFALPVSDLSNLDHPEERAQDLARAEARVPLDLERGPLVRAQLLRVQAEVHVLLFTMHHIIFDGWSRRIFIQELSSLYDAFCAGRPSSLPNPKLQYADYAVWQRQRLQGPTLEKQLSYWRKQLAHLPASLDLPTDRPRPAVQTFNGGKVPVLFSKALTDQLNAFSREHGVTLFMTLLAGFQALLARYSNQNDIAVGIPIANRNRAELEEMIGFFANTLVMRTQFAESMSFKDLVSQVRETSLDAYAHQDMPFEKLVEELRPDRNLSQNPLFQVLFSLQNAPRVAFELPGLKLKLMDTGETTSKFDISAFLLETPDGVRGRFEFNTDLFDSGTIERMLGHFEVLLEAAVANPTALVADLPLLGEAERHKILVEWNQTASDYPHESCLPQMIAEQAQRSSNAVAVVFGKEEITYRKLDEKANQLAQYLRKRGITTESLVGIYLERSIDMIVALLAVLKAGGAYVPLDPAYPPERIGFILEDAGAALLISQSDLLGALSAEHQNKSIALDAISTELAKENREAPAQNINPENLAYVLYTSGSTGKPKGVQITHRNLVNFLCSMQKEPGLNAKDVLLGVTTLSFDIAGLEIYLPLISGARLLLASRAEASDGRLLLALLEGRKPTIMQATPATWRMLIEAGWKGSSKLKVLCGGEALPADLVEQLIPRCGQLWNMYGPTETTIWSSVYRVESAVATAPIGKPIANTTFYVLDAQKQPVPIGVGGELYIGGDGVARGYYHRPELTAEKFVADPFSKTSADMYRTGDVARYLADGNVQYLGRTDFQVKVRGFRIELGEIESVLAKHPAVLQAVVAAREDSPGDKRLVAYIVPQPESHLGIGELRAHVKQSLPDYMVPSAVVELDALPLTPNGKVDRKTLPKPELSGADSAASIPPRDQLEESLAKIWCGILGVTTVGVTDNFFDLGGHSLMAVRLMNEIKHLTGISLPLTALFQGATIERLADLLRGDETVPPAVAHRIQSGSGERPPFFAAVLAGVNALGYIPLSKHLGPDQPFYTLQSPGSGPREKGKPYTQKEYEVAASEYVRSMRSVQPNGPYYIGGTCEGARIAFEMTRILEASGERVALFAVIDTWVLENTQNRGLWKIYYYYDQIRRMLRQPWRTRLEVMQRVVGNRLRRWTGAQSAPRKSEWRQAYWPGQDFVPAQIQGRITVFKIPKQPFYYRPDPLLGWGNRTTAGVDTLLVPHGKHTLLLREPYVRELASALSQALKGNHDEPKRPAQIVANEPESADAAAVSR